ncbi:MAG: glycoside hydrolase family 95 protein, partial [Cyclobacteriaceae bacterium]|nr:glycoside hydrolase family 95 protein [Cyclobacteriaceae bacterium]
DSLRAMVSQIAPTQIGKHGQIQEWLTDVDDPENKHRHISHLWAHHPGNEITIEKTPELAAAVRTSLIHRGDEGTGWSLAWKINQWARLKDGGHCEELFKLLFSAAGSGVSYSRGGSYPNLFDAHPPFQIDGNFGAAAGILEMILQSHKDKIELLPALPSLWPSGNLKGVKARGGFELDISWGNHKLTKVKVLSRTGNPLVLNYGDKTIQIATTKAMTYQFDGQLNQTIE